MKISTVSAKLIVTLLSAPLFFSGCGQKSPSTVTREWSSVYRAGTGRPVSMILSVYSTTMIANGSDETEVRVAVADSTGREIADATTPFTIEVRGDASVETLPGNESPELVSETDTLTVWRAALADGLFHFRLITGTEPGHVRVEVRSDSLYPSSHEIHTLPASFRMVTPSADQIVPSTIKIDRMLGADISFLPQFEERGMKFRVDGKETDAVRALADEGFNYIRLRIFVNPENPGGYSPVKGFCGLDQTKAMALRIREAGMKLLLDFHYSDYWADPQQQNKPLAWADLSPEELVLKVNEYTKEVLASLKEQGTPPAMVQIGNEINHGLLWPDGHISNPDMLAEILKAGTSAVRETDPEIPVMMHIALGGQNSEARFWLDNMIGRGVDFDLIGLSYYPRWHGTLDDLQANLTDLALRYKKDINVVEYSDYKEEVHDIVFSLPGDRGKGTAIWEPLFQMFGRDGEANDNLFVYKSIFNKYYSTNQD